MKQLPAVGKSIFFIAACAMSLSTAAQNLVTNGSFGAGGAGWTFFAPATGTEAYNPETSYGGTVGTNTVGEIDNGANLRQQNIPVTPGVTYYLSFRRTRRTLGGAPNPTGIKVSVYNGANSFLNQDVFSNNTTWNWQCEIFQFTPTTNTIDLDFSNITTTITTLGTMVDDITITPQEQLISFSGNSCQGGSFSLSAPSGNGPDNQYSNYSWTGPNGFTSSNQQISFTGAQPNMNGMYTCTMTLNGCVQVSGSYNLTISPSTFNRTADICSGVSYNFYGRELYEQGTYDILIAGGNNNCDSFIILQLNVHPLPDAAIHPAGDIAICTGDTAALNISNPQASVNYQWQQQSGSIPGETGNPYYAFTTGSYRVVATTAQGCSDTSAWAYVTTHDLIPAGILFNEGESYCIGDTVAFRAGAGGSYYLWMPQALFRGVSGAEGPAVNGKLTHSETTVSLTVFNDIGCPSGDTVVVNARACCNLFMPDAFSPNDDGLNDYFLPYIDRAQIIVHFAVYNRYGNLVYEHNGGKGWSGHYPGGAAAAPGVYMYLLQYTCGDQQVQTKRGDVTLIR